MEGCPSDQIEDYPLRIKLCGRVLLMKRLEGGDLPKRPRYTDSSRGEMGKGEKGIA